jgi:hypothetical protein
MQENCQNINAATAITDQGNNISSENIHLHEAKGKDSNQYHHSWSPRMEWKAVPKPQPFAAVSSNAFPATTIATLNCGECHEDILTCEVGFDTEDQIYTRKRFNTSFEETVLDAAIRGGTVAGQFELGLPAELSLVRGVNSFAF